MAPATPFDAERIDSYRRGTVVNVRLTEDRDRILVRKWWAVLGLAIKQCETPWKNKEEASEAIKLALGIVNLSKTVSGQFMQYPKSLNDLDDPEMTEALDQMMELLHRITGVDPATLRKEAASVGEELATPAQDTGEIEDQERAADASPVDAAPVGEADAPNVASPAPTPTPDKQLLIRVFRSLYAAVGPDLDVIDAQSDIFADDFVKANEVTQRKAQVILAQIKLLGQKKIEDGHCIEYLAGVIGVEPHELTTPE